MKKKAMSKRNIILIINLVISGLIALILSQFFAEGAIAENYTGEPCVAPEFFVILIIWGIGALFALIHYFKVSISYFILSLLISWVSLPLGLYIGFSIQ